MIDLPRSTYYYRSTARAAQLRDEHLVTLIAKIQDELPGYGNRRVTRELANQGIRVNHKRMPVSCGKMGLQ